MNSFRLNPLFFPVLLFFCFSCRSPEEKQLEQALELAGNNRQELEKALNYYSPTSKDSLKYKAIHFLIRNMPGSWGVDSSFLQAYQPFYDVYHALVRKYDGNIYSALPDKIDSIWEIKRSRLPQPENEGKSDLHHISSRYLIRETEAAFRAWQENCYTRHCSFEEFCEYILPYRRKNGLIADSSRQVFYRRHQQHFFKESSRGFIPESDSLLYLYRHITHNFFHGSSIPILSASSLEYLEKGLCEHRCWFNSLLFSSLGMAVAVDFVPAWGNRNNSHTWNVLIIGGQSYAFESFWDNNRWKYKRIYNNKTYDPEWGAFRLPKVYRHTYSYHPEGPVKDSRISKEDIPPLFRNTKKKDVSAEYFDTTDVTLTLTEEVPEDTYYAYLCVFGYQQWQPVQWGRIKGNSVTFKGMGKDIVYLPAFYKQGEVFPAGPPFYLHPDNRTEPLIPDTSTQCIVINNTEGSPFYQWGRNELQYLAGSLISGSHFPDFRDAGTLARIPACIYMEEEKVAVNTTEAYRYIRLSGQRDTFAAGEIRFYLSDTVFCTPFSIHSGYTPLSPEEQCSYLTDNCAVSGFKGKKSTSRFIDFDLGKSMPLKAIGYTLYLRNNTDTNYVYELQYWEGKEWKTAGRQRGQKNFLRFCHVPSNALYQLKNTGRHTPRSGERIFLYQNQEVLWK